MKLKNLLLLSGGITLLWVGLLMSATAERPALIQVGIENRADIQNLQALGLDIVEIMPDQYVEILVSDEDLLAISEAGYSYKVIHADMTAYLQSKLTGQMDMGGYHTLDEVYLVMDSIHNQYPGLTTAKDSIGYTIEGRPIYAMKVSDNPEIDEDEPEVFFNALTHAREPMGMEVLLYFMHYLTDNYGSNARVDSIVNNRELWFIPVANPDGYHYNEFIAPEGGGLWRKNRRDNGGSFGVDLNRNYGYKWGYNNIGSSASPSSQTYRGTAPFSEPETQAIRDFVLARDFVITVNYHTFSDLLLYAWGYIGFQPPDRLVYEVLAETATSVNNYVWGPGYSTIYETNGDADDWMYGEQFLKKKSLSFTPEVGGSEDGGFWPPAYMIPVMTLENLEANLLFAEFAGPYSQRSFWSLATEPVFIDTVVYWGDSLSIPLILYNHGNNGTVNFKAQSSESPEWLTLIPENNDTTIPALDTFILDVRLTSENLNLGGSYYSEIKILSYNSLTAPYSDTTLIPVLVDMLCSGAQLPGDANASGNYTLADVIAIVNYVFNKPGCTPQPLCWLSNLLCRGDWNATGNITLSDVIQAVNYVFSKPGGPWDPVSSDICCIPG